MKRLLLSCLLSLGLVFGVFASPAGADTWPQNYHWPRWYGTGSTATETRVYFVADVKRMPVYQRAYVSWAAHRWSASPAVSVIPITSDRCPTRPDGIKYNCVVWRTGNNGGGFTNINFDSSKHITFALVTLDDQVGLGTDYVQDRYIACHEGGHSLGGGFDDPRTAYNEHHLCNKANGYPTSEDYASIAGAYNHHG